MEYNPDAHDRHSIRLQNWNYANTGSYFVTVCCQNMEHLFGNIVVDKMELNICGEIAMQCWQKIPQHFPDVILNDFVIMPNHLHGVICIPRHDTQRNVNAPRNVGALHATPLRTNATSLRQTNVPMKNVYMSSISPKHETLSVIIRSYKSAVSKQIHEIGFIGQIWQRNYYERIIRDEAEHARIAEYIRNNPVSWKKEIS